MVQQKNRPTCAANNDVLYHYRQRKAPSFLKDDCGPGQLQRLKLSMPPQVHGVRKPWLGQCPSATTFLQSVGSGRSRERQSQFLVEH
jgi:hypothetical protein